MSLKEILETSRKKEQTGLSPRLRDMLNITAASSKIGLSEERVRAILPAARDYIAFWREYPDLFVDFMVRGNRTEPREGEFKFYFYQRVFLRAVMRYQYVYCVFPRAYSKSFLSVMALMIRCILFPRSNLFVTSGGKEQASGILKDKVNEICTLIPALKKEIDWRRGKTLEGKDQCRYVFLSESTLENMAARESSRGKRKTGGLIEECVGVDGKILQEVIIPTMAVSRRAMDGTKHEEESVNKSQIFITTAGYKGTFAYDKLIQLLVRMVIKPDKCIILGGTWRLPVAVGLQSRTFIKDQQEDGTFNEASFNREFESRWTGDVADAFFNAETFDKNRILNQPEYEASTRSKGSYYVISVDVARFKRDQTAICIFCVTPTVEGQSIKKLVNLYALSDEHMGDQALAIKKLYYKYNARRVVIDANGLGAGLVDYMVKPSIDPETQQVYPDFGVYNATFEGWEAEYKKFRSPECEDNAMYLIKANAPINTEAHSNASIQLSSGRVKLLIDEKIAKIKLLGTSKGQKMTPEERKIFLLPFTLTSSLREEMMNLREDNEGVNIILKQANRKIRKDKFSSFEYGLYYIRQEEDNKKKKKRFNAKDWKFFTPGGFGP